MQQAIFRRIFLLRRRFTKMALSLLSFLFLIGCKLDFPEQW